jgi:AraC-like DNA-binding protein
MLDYQGNAMEKGSIEEYVKNRCSDCLFNVFVMSQELGISESYLRENIHCFFKCCPCAFIETARLQIVIEDMADPNIDLYSIQQKCGYSCSKTFRRAVKKRLGKPPSYIRNQIQNAGDKQKEIDKWLNILWIFINLKDK